MSNDLAPKLRHITDIAIANNGKISDFCKILYFNLFCRYYYPFLLPVCYLKKADFYALFSDAEFREYLAENIVVGDFACDGAQVVDDLADVFA